MCLQQLFSQYKLNPCMPMNLRYSSSFFNFSLTFSKSFVFFIKIKMNSQKLKFPELFQAKCFSGSIVLYHYLDVYVLRFIKVYSQSNSRFVQDNVPIT